MAHRLLAAVLLALCCGSALLGGELRGKVIAVNQETLVVRLEGELAPNRGDAVRIVEQVPGLEDLALAATGKVAEVKADGVTVTVADAPGGLARGQLALITSANPRPRARPADPPSPMIPPSSNPADTTELKQFWNVQRLDNALLATVEGEKDVLASGYQYVRIEGRVLTREDRISGWDTPLKSYWNPQRGDTFLTATEEGHKSAIDSGYKLVRTEGYVCSKPGQGLVPLKLYWSAERGDNFTVATAEAEKDALNTGYKFARIEGYVLPPLEPQLDPAQPPPALER